MITIRTARNRELRRAVAKAIAEGDNLSAEQVYHRAALTATSRFWISEERAYNVLLAFRRNTPPPLKGTRRRMYLDLWDRVCDILDRHPGVSFIDAVHQAVNSPAPEFYLTPKSVRVILQRRYSA